jgi:hypothetical protein
MIATDKFYYSREQNQSMMFNGNHKKERINALFSKNEVSST